MGWIKGNPQQLKKGQLSIMN